MPKTRISGHTTEIKAIPPKDRRLLKHVKSAGLERFVAMEYSQASLQRLGHLDANCFLTGLQCVVLVDAGVCEGQKTTARTNLVGPTSRPSQLSQHVEVLVPSATDLPADTWLDWKRGLQRLEPSEEDDTQTWPRPVSPRKDPPSMSREVVLPTQPSGSNSETSRVRF